MKNYKIEFVIKVSEKVSENDVNEWARFMVGDIGSITIDNPLYDQSFDPLYGTFKIEAVQR